MQLARLERDFVSVYRSFLDAKPIRITEEPLDPEFRKFVHALSVCSNQIERYQANKKVVEHIDSEFRRKWNHYCRNWKIHVDRLYNLGIGGEFRLGPRPLAEYRSLASQGPREVDPRSMPFHFDPKIHTGGSAIRHLHKAIEMVIDREELPESYWEADDIETEQQIELLNRLQVGTEALEYFERHIGIDIGRAFEKWHQLPTILLPVELGAKEDEESKRPLYELLNDAVRAYLAGATAASVAMCRAVLEMVLREYYLADERLGRDDEVCRPLRTRIR
mgnify:FL=1